MLPVFIHSVLIRLAANPLFLYKMNRHLIEILGPNAKFLGFYNPHSSGSGKKREKTQF